MILPIFALIIGLVVLVWSADRFIDGASATAIHLGMPQLLIGIIIVGFGTSAPEMLVSAVSALEGSPGIALGNAYGSNISNIALILGVTAIISPVIVHRSILLKELPLLLGASLLTVGLLWDKNISRLDGVILMIALVLVMARVIRQGMKHAHTNDEDLHPGMTFKKAIITLLVGLILLVISSRFLVWGAVEIAHALGISDLIIGLTVVSVGTSLPELASSIVAAKKKQHAIVLGNIIGSNLFNTLAVVGIAAIISPLEVEPAILTRDMPVMLGLTFMIFLFGFNLKNQEGCINRVKGGILLGCFVAYTLYIATSTLFKPFQL